jgi:D-arabinose 1-dehydrogenase-like Zn-dependent alcohol dehydrogenase
MMLSRAIQAQINEAFEHVAKGKGRYRVVLDMTTGGDPTLVSK